MAKKKSQLGSRLLKHAFPTAKLVLQSKLLMILLGLAAFGFWAGKHSVHDPTAIPFEELFENMSVLS